MKYSEVIIWLGEKQMELYHRQPQAYLQAFIAGSCNRDIIRQYYGVLSKRGLIMPLEVIDPVYKQEIKDLVIEKAEGKLNMEGCMNMAKLIHIVATYNNGI